MPPSLAPLLPGRATRGALVLGSECDLIVRRKLWPTARASGSATFLLWSYSSQEALPSHPIGHRSVLPTPWQGGRCKRKAPLWELTFTVHLSCTWHGSKYFLYVNSLHLTITLCGRHSYYPILQVRKEPWCAGEAAWGRGGGALILLLSQDWTSSASPSSSPFSPVSPPPLL